MYSVKPLGINIKDNDRDVPDGSLQESINMQWRDGSFKIIPERLISDINAYQYDTIIFHKVGDENQVNVLGFNQYGTAKYLAFNLADYLAGSLTGNKRLYWFGTILNGDYTPKTPVEIDVTKTDGMSFTILNGLIYFMGDGSNVQEQYYLKVEFDETTQNYKVYDMYKWKSLIPFFPYQQDISLLAPKNSYNVFSQCGIVLIRFALVLKSGEIVLHSPIYGYLMYGINRSDTAFAKGDLIENIHTFINMDLSFTDNVLFDEEISAINVYASVADYESKFLQAYSDVHSIAYLYQLPDIKGRFAKKAEEPFYLVKTIEKPTTTEKLLLTVGPLDTDIVLPENVDYTYSRVDIISIAAGELMSVDNFSYHKVYGKITSYNGRLVVKRPTTVLSGGHMRALATTEVASNQAFQIITEDGTLNGISYFVDKGIEYSGTKTYVRGILSYPDIRTSLVGSNDSMGNDIRMFKCRKNVLHNMSCDFDMAEAGEKMISFVNDTVDPSKLKSTTDYCVYVVYDNSVTATGGDLINYTVDIPSGSGVVAFDMPTAVDATKGMDVVGYAAGGILDTIYVKDTDYTVSEEGGDGGVGQFVFVDPPTVASIRFLYYSKTVVSVTPEIPSVSPTGTDANVKYISENRIQFSEIGEYKVWPAINSYRIGEGKVMSLGIGSVNPSESQIISPIIIGTSDGTYTVNLDPMGNNFIASITKSKNIPFISEEILEIDNDVLFVSDQGLMVYSNGDYQNLTKDFFPQQGNGGFPLPNNVFANYNLLTSEFLGGSGNPYHLDDIVAYLRGALMAYDSRRKNIWCSNPNKNFSLVYNLDVKQWCMSTTVFTQKSELFSIINTDLGGIYTQYMVKIVGKSNLAILSGEDLTKEVFYHVLTRSIKSQYADDFKLLTRAFVRTLIVRQSNSGYVYLGLWGQHDIDRNKKSIPIAIKKDNRAAVFPNNIRYHLPIDCRKGKYKALTFLQGGKALPESYIASFDLDIYLVDNKKMR